jgi:hypothetical protein
MYLNKTMQARVSLFTYARMGFATKEYDLAVIGGGPGGKN